MNCNPHDTIEQHAIELVSSLGKEHLFVANCPSDIDSNRYSGTVITYEEAFDHSDTGVGLCLLLPKAYVLQKFIDICLNKDISVHFVFTCSSSTSEFEASAWLYNLLNDKVQHVGFMQNLGVTFCSANNQEKYLIACQVEPYAEHCHVSWSRPCRTLEYVFPRTVVERHQTISELQSRSTRTSIFWVISNIYIYLNIYIYEQTKLKLVYYSKTKLLLQNHTSGLLKRGHARFN